MDTVYKAKVIDAYKNARATRLSLSNGETLNISPFAYVGPGDTIQVTASKEEIKSVKKMLRHTISEEERWITLAPIYNVKETINIPPHVFVVNFRERIVQADHARIKRLEAFHYRGQGLHKIPGRRSLLLAEDSERGVIAYGVVSSTLPAAKPRFELFKTNMGDQMKSKLINQLVRVPRIVVHPEFRGMGIGAIMARHLISYVEGHWDINGYAPILIEVIAAMTEYHRFFEAAGFIRYGDTMGYKESNVRPQYGSGAFQARNNTNQYQFLQDQGAKPYLVYPLTSKVKELIETKMPPDEQQSVRSCRHQLTEVIKFRSISVSYKPMLPSAERARIVKEAFGIDGSQLDAPILNKLSVSIEPGDVLLVTGASGSGKSTLIKLLTTPENELANLINVEGTISGLGVSSIPEAVAQLSLQFDDERPLIDQIGNTASEAIHLLNAVGLAEAHLYLKGPHQISEGQRYRFAVAKLCASNKPLWVADEFASTLDAETAAIMARGIRKIACSRGATVILAASRVDAFSASLMPNTLLKLSWGDTINLQSLKLKTSATNHGFNISVRNRTTKPIPYLQVGLIDDHGMFHVVKDIDIIGSRGKSDDISIDAKLLNKKTHVIKALAVRSQNGVGDIAYLTSKRS